MTNPTPDTPTPGASTAPHLHPDAAARFRDYTTKPVSPEAVAAFPIGSPERQRGDQHLREQKRRQRLPKAIAYYTSPALGFTITPINFPVLLATPRTPSHPGTAGLNSDGKLYLTETTFAASAPTENEVLARADQRDISTISKALPDGTQLPSNYSNSPGKNPVLTGFTRTPSAQARTPEQAAALWANAPWNVGIVTGPSTGTICIDIDARHHGLQMFTLLVSVLAYIADAKREIEPSLSAIHDDLRQTFGYSSSSGGFHLLFHVDRDDTAAWKLINRMGTNPLPGVDLKTRPGIVVAAPSLHATGDQYNTPNPTLPPHSTHRTYPPRQLNLSTLSTLYEALRVIRSLPSTVYESLFNQTTSTTFINSTITTEHITAIGAILSAGIAPQENGVNSFSSRGTAGTTTAQSGGFAALASQAEQRENAQSPIIPDGDNSLNEGYYSRQVEHWLATGEPHTCFGPGEHNDSLKGLIGALLKLVPISPTMGTYYANQMRRDPNYIPPLYASLAIDLDNAVTEPKPWHQTEGANFTGLLRYAVRAELVSLGYISRDDM